MSNLSKSRLDHMHTIMRGYVERGELPGLVTLVSKHGEVHVDAVGKKANGGGNPIQRDTIFRIASMTKPITAVAAMILVEECKLRLDDPVDSLLPELANRRVLRQIDSPLDDTVPANRSITLRDLLTFRLGIGAVMAPPGQYPIQSAIAEAGLAPSADPPTISPDLWLEKLGQLPLIHQPGEMWMYHTGYDVLGILIARTCGQSLEDFFYDRIFEPLGMLDTGFYVPEAKWDRLPPSYLFQKKTGEFVIHDKSRDGRWARPPVFPSGGGGLVSTADDYLSFYQMMLNKGVFKNRRILSRPSIELMTTDHLTPEQKAAAYPFFYDNSGWGFGVAVNTRRDDLYMVTGRFGWDGGIGTSAYADPKEGLIGILMTQRLMDSPDPPLHFRDFWTSVYQAIAD
ncbi:class A beta-lactamase-related serine hydrolase [Brevibacillus invocatus]|uniref:Class A beta-lactamase-related serine hydrolase n=1 Tax=Brevibacillus invocatus TaxID=173959 RepID=A0A3M8BZE8_9BACL|nr:serine hydrolase domain-containing protein [Brevibacillus invocatus]RNB68467.1 class A beta-lactamase-related serine hydrolase [Brevibacillus invocatus]